MLGVSVVIPCYNAARFIRETLDSILTQNYGGPLEVLVADDGSTDGSADVVASYGPPVRLLMRGPHEERSASHSRNRCLQAATQPLVAFLDADDLFMPGHLVHLAEALTRRPELGFVYDKGYYVSADGSGLSPIFAEPHRPRVTPDDLLVENCIVPAAVVVRREVFARVGLFDEELRHAEDHDMWLRILEAYPAEHVSAYGFKYRIHEGQKSLKPALWTSAALVLAKACRRYPYHRSSIRRRKAVLAFRFSQAAFAERRYLRGLCRLVKAALLDPPRGAQQAYESLRQGLSLTGAKLRNASPRRRES